MLNNKYMSLGVMLILLGIAMIVVLSFDREKNFSSDGVFSNTSAFSHTPTHQNMFITKPQREERTIINLTLVAEPNAVVILPNTTTLLWNYNNKFPGPTIVAKKGDMINVTIINRLDVPTTVHWHGMRVPNQMDGVPDITQKPIMPGESFTYNFTILDEGVFIYHPHYNTAEQIEMGLYGSVIVYDDNDPYVYDKDLLLTLDDILLDEKGQVYEVFDTMHQRMMGRFGNVLLVNGVINPRYDVEKGDIVRLRMVNIANARTFYVSLEGNTSLRFMVIGEDIGFSTEPYMTEVLEIAPGQRYDVLVFFSDKGEYTLSTYIGNKKYALATINVKDREVNLDEKKRLYDLNKNIDIKKHDIEDLLHNIPNATTLTVELYPEGNMMNMKWTLNGKAYPDDTLFIPVKEGKYYILELKNINPFPHPMHIHGQRLIEIGNKTSYAFKDTVIVPPHQTLRAIFKAEGKGLWLFHCHILEHATAGMISVIEVK